MSKTKILVIDDEKGIINIFKGFLEYAGYSVATANNYNEGEKKINDTKFDLILTDIILGEKTGIDVLKMVKEKKIQCPVIVFTADPSVETASEAVRLGAFDYLIKPVERIPLLNATRLALQHKALSEEKEKYRANITAIFRSVKDAIVTVDNELNILEVNEAADSICGISRDRDLGKSFDSIPKHCSGVCADALKKTIQWQQPVEKYRLECFPKKGGAKVVSLSTHPLLDSENNFSGCVMVVKNETRLAQLEKGVDARDHFHNMVGKSRKMQEAYSFIDKLADIETSVLVTGESGTGKELVAEALHHRGRRRDKPLVKVNCAGLSEELIESELFGHVKGAFTGAIADKKGRFESADGGTIFLDEIGDISTKMQLRLLRVLQEKEVELVGDNKPVKLDVRVIAATNQDLRKKVRLKKFREDLYHRLNVVELRIPPLRERSEDLSILIDHFLEKLNKKLNKEAHGITDEVFNFFQNYQWPGNIRELEHTLERAIIAANQSVVTVDDLPPHLIEKNGASIPSFRGEENQNQERILKALEESRWNKTKAARILGVDRRTLFNKMKEYGMN